MGLWCNRQARRRVGWSNSVVLLLLLRIMLLLLLLGLRVGLRVGLRDRRIQSRLI